MRIVSRGRAISTHDDIGKSTAVEGLFTSEIVGDAVRGSVSSRYRPPASLWNVEHTDDLPNVLEDIRTSQLQLGITHDDCCPGRDYNQTRVSVSTSRMQLDESTHPSWCPTSTRLSPKSSQTA